MEVLNALLEQVDSCGMLSPLPGNMVKFRASIYVDDLVIFLRPVPEDFSCIKAILDLFVGASGLLTNLEKCTISPIRCTDEDVHAIWEVFPCQLSPFPCRYLGAPLSTTSLKRSDEQVLVAAVVANLEGGDDEHLGEASSCKIDPIRNPRPRVNLLLLVCPGNQAD
jgi:hypothetical protein